MKKRSNWRLFWDLMTEDWYIFYFAIAWFVPFLSIVLAVLVFGTPPNSKELVLQEISFVVYTVGVAAAIGKSWNNMVRLKSTKHVPVVVVSGKSRTDAKHILEVAKDTITKGTGFKQFKQMENHFGISIEDKLLITDENNLQPDDPDQWLKLLNRIQDGVRYAGDQVPGDKVYHVFLFGYGISSLAMALGAVFGTRHKVVVYQLGSGDEWHPVLNLTSDIRRVKQATTNPNYQYIQTSVSQKFDSDTAMILNMAAHIPTAYVQSNLQKQKVTDWTLVEVNNTYEGNLKDKDWIPAVQELFSVYSQIHRAGPSRVHVFMSMPTALAFGLGIGMGMYNRVIVYAWDNKETYYPVFSLDKLEGTL